MHCTICRHPQLEEIAVSLVRNGTRDTARRFGMSRSALDRHKKHLPSTLVKAHEAKEVAAASSVLSQLRELVSDCRIIAGKAQAARQWSQATAALREVRSTLELLARLEMEIQKNKSEPPLPPKPDGPDARENLRVLTERLRARIALRKAHSSAPTAASGD
jgi:hypothetical protein